MKALKFRIGDKSFGNKIKIEKIKDNLYEVISSCDDFGCYWACEIEMTEDEYKVIKALEEVCGVEIERIESEQLCF